MQMPSVVQLELQQCNRSAREAAAWARNAQNASGGADRDFEQSDDALIGGITRF